MAFLLNFENHSENILSEILSWDLKKFGDKKKYYHSQKIPINLISTEDFQIKLEPLFFEELRAQIYRILKINFNLSELNKGKIIWKGIKNQKFILLVNFFFKKFRKFRRGDLIILGKNSEIIKNSKFNKLGFGIILSISQNKNEICIRIDYKIWKKLMEKKIKIIFFCSISIIRPALKEYCSLYSLKKIPNEIKQILFSKKKIDFEPFFEKDNFEKNHLNFHFNISQLKGIFAMLWNKITLIQGPPGTGKTRTILGIIALILWKFKKIEKINNKTNFFNFIFSSYFEKPHGKNKIHFNFLAFNHILFKPDFFLKKKNIDLTKNEKRIMICAFSNAAIDENTMRITQGLPMRRRGFWNKPFTIIRLGPNYKFFIDHITLDNYSLIWASENDYHKTIWNSYKILKKSRMEILKKCSIIYTTLACANYSLFEKIMKNETLIIDEAAQSIEILTLAPIRKNCEKVIMIGDIQQLPATVFSQTSVDFDYDRSLFKRLQLKKFPIWFLETQYRMHPQIASFIARKFYKNGLKDSQNVAFIKNFHFLRCFGPMIFFDVCEGIDQFHLKQKNSWCNLDEIRFISLFIRTIICLFSNFNIKSIGIIASYQGQINEIQDFGIMKKNTFKGQINTVDGFQGREKEIIFFTSVRAKTERGIGFLSDCRRMNVAFTRAKSSFWSIGNASVLKKDSNWSEGIFDAQKRGRFFCVRKPLERSNRRLLYWNATDDENYVFDAENFLSLNFFLLTYIQNFFL